MWRDMWPCSGIKPEWLILCNFCIFGCNKKYGTEVERRKLIQQSQTYGLLTHCIVQSISIFSPNVTLRTGGDRIGKRKRKFSSFDWRQERNRTSDCGFLEQRSFKSIDEVLSFYTECWATRNQIWQCSKYYWNISTFKIALYIIPILIQNFIINIFVHLSVISVVLSEPPRGTTAIYFFFLSRKLLGYIIAWAYSVQTLPIDLKRIKLQFILLLVLPERLALQIKQMHAIARLWSKWTSCKWNLQGLKFIFPLTFQRKWGRSPQINGRAEKPLQIILLGLWTINVTFHTQWAGKFYVLKRGKKKRKGAIRLFSGEIHAYE